MQWAQPIGNGSHLVPTTPTPGRQMPSNKQQQHGRLKRTACQPRPAHPVPAAGPGCMHAEEPPTRLLRHVSVPHSPCSGIPCQWRPARGRPSTRAAGRRRLLPRGRSWGAAAGSRAPRRRAGAVSMQGAGQAGRGSQWARDPPAQGGMCTTPARPFSPGCRGTCLRKCGLLAKSAVPVVHGHAAR